MIDLSDRAVTCLADYSIGSCDQVGVIVVTVCRKEKDIRCHPFFFSSNASNYEVNCTEILVEPIHERVFLGYATHCQENHRTLSY